MERSPKSAFTWSKLTTETLEQGVIWNRSGVFIVNFEYISHIVLVFLLLTLNTQFPGGQSHANRWIDKLRKMSKIIARGDFVPYIIRVKAKLHF